MKRKLKPEPLEYGFDIDDELDENFDYEIPLKIKKHRDKVNVVKKKPRRDSSANVNLF